MTERRTTRRYDLSLPIIIRVPAERQDDSQEGKTRDISTRGLYFVIEQDLEAGSELDITLTHFRRRLLTARRFLCAPLEELCE
jgi:hypothetical protein